MAAGQSRERRDASARFDVCGRNDKRCLEAVTSTVRFDVIISDDSICRNIHISFFRISIYRIVSYLIVEKDIELFDISRYLKKFRAILTLFQVNLVPH